MDYQVRPIDAETTDTESRERTPTLHILAEQHQCSVGQFAVFSHQIEFVQDGLLAFRLSTFVQTLVLQAVVMK